MLIYYYIPNTMLIYGSWSKAPDKKPPGQKPSDDNPPRIIEEIIAKYAVDAGVHQS